MMIKTLERKTDVFEGDLGETLSLEFKEEDEKTGIIEGYAAVFNNTDNGGDVILPGAFTESLTSIPATKVKLLYQHNPYEPIGKILSLTEDQTGLYMKAQILEGVQRGKECLELVREDAIEGLSIGYRAREFTRSERRDDLWDRKIIKLDLFEISVVTFPMNKAAGVRLVKSENLLPTEREFEQFLARDAGFSAQQAKAIVADGYKSLLTARDAGAQDDCSEADFIAAMKQATEKARTAG
jgi:HK97 family phage prohead protease